MVALRSLEQLASVRSDPYRRIVATQPCPGLCSAASPQWVEVDCGRKIYTMESADATYQGLPPAL